GAVNAIDKAEMILAAVRRLSEDWSKRPELRHPLLKPGSLVATVIAGGEWWVTFPATCQITFDVTYLPAQADADGYGSAVRYEFEEWIAAAARDDEWLTEHPPAFTWSTDLPPAEVADDHQIVVTAMSAAEPVARATRVGRPGWVHSIPGPMRRRSRSLACLRSASGHRASACTPRTSV